MIKYANPILCRQIIERMDEISELTETEKNCVRALCRKEIPYEPIEKVIIGEKDKFRIGRCPRCNNGVNQEMLFCDTCGQAIDWMWEDEK